MYECILKEYGIYSIRREARRQPLPGSPASRKKKPQPEATIAGASVFGRTKSSVDRARSGDESTYMIAQIRPGKSDVFDAPAACGRAPMLFRQKAVNASLRPESDAPLAYCEAWRETTRHAGRDDDRIRARSAVRSARRVGYAEKVDTLKKTGKLVEHACTRVKK